MVKQRLENFVEANQCLPFESYADRPRRLTKPCHTGIPLVTRVEKSNSRHVVATSLETQNAYEKVDLGLLKGIFIEHIMILLD